MYTGISKTVKRNTIDEWSKEYTVDEKSELLSGVSTEVLGKC